MRAFLQGWSQPSWRTAAERSAGRPLDHIASDQFARRGIERGDRVYVVGNDSGRLILIGRISVEEMLGQAEAESRLGRPLWEARWHLLGRGTPMRFDRALSEDNARGIIGASGRPLRLDPDQYQLDPMTLVTVREITAESAAILDSVLNVHNAGQLATDAIRHGLSASERKAVEERAMHLAERHLRRVGWKAVVRTAERASWDYEVSDDRGSARVEVKGSTGPIGAIDLTRNEVESAQAHSHSIPVLVGGIALEGPKPRALGGQLTMIDPGSPSDEDLRAERYTYRVPRAR